MYPLPKDKYLSWLPHGFDLLNAKDTQKRLFLEKNIRELLSQIQYREISLPGLDYAKTFELTTRHAKYNPVFRLRAGEGEELAVRSDLTVQLIKAAANGRLGDDFRKGEARFCYIQPVFYDYPWGSGHRREIIQAGVEILNYQLERPVPELLKLAIRCASLGKLEPRILYGDIRVIELLFQKVPKKIRSELSLAFHNKDTAIIPKICEKGEVDKELKDILTKIPLLFGGREALKELKKLCRSSPELMACFAEAEAMEGVVFDFSLARELSYYTGPVFTAYIPGTNEKIFTGGVYDKLFSKFSETEECRACGFALDISLMVEKFDGDLESRTSRENKERVSK